MVDTKVYSYHTYMLPFVWKYPGNHIQSSLEHIAGVFDSNPSWIPSNRQKNQEAADIVLPKTNEIEEARLFYKEYQYFRPYVRDALYGYDPSLVRCYEFANVHNKGHYLISKNGTTYDLMINAIRVMLYNTGIGMFIMECENHKDTNDGAQANFDAVKNINDYGRRINLPFLPEPSETNSSVCADKLEVVLNETTSFASDFKDHLISHLKSADSILSTHSMTYIASFIKEILGYGGDYKFTSTESSADSETVYIYPALDDRMFVMSYVYDQEAASAFVALSDEKDKDSVSYKTNSKLADSLYEYVFSDSAGNCSCQSDQMRDQLLDEHVYKRWLKYGSIYTIAPQGMHMLTNYPADHLRDSFLTQYNRMCLLCLVQLASLEFFEHELKIINTGKHKGLTVFTMQTRKLRNRYAQYQSQIGFNRISSQEQAIEMFDMLRKAFDIDHIEKGINEDISALAEMASSRSSQRIGIFAAIITATELVNIIFRINEAGQLQWFDLSYYFMIVPLAILAIEYYFFS